MVKIIETLDVFESVAEEWNKLAEPFESPLLRHEWFYSYAKVHCPPGQLKILIAKTNEDVRAIAPLYLTKHNGVTRLELLGDRGELSGLIYKDKKDLNELIKAMLELKEPIYLRRLGSESLELKILKEFTSRIFSRFEEAPASPWLNINGKWDEFESTLSSRRRSDLRRACRRAEKFGKLESEIISPTSENLDYYLQKVFEIEASGWKGKQGSSILAKPKLQQFLTEYSHSIAKSNLLRLCFLKAGGMDIAAEIAIEYANRFWILKIGYNQEYARCSPGMIITHETIKYAFDNRLESYEFLGDDAHWIHVWTEELHRRVSVLIYPFSLHGITGLLKHSFRFLINRIPLVYKENK